MKKKSVDETITNTENCTRCRKQNEEQVVEIHWKILHIIIKFELVNNTCIKVLNKLRNKGFAD